MNVFIEQRTINRLFNLKIESGFKSEASQNSQRIVFESLQRSKWSPNYLVINIRNSFLSPILNLLCIQVVKK